MKTLKQFIKQDCGGKVAEACRRIGAPRITVERWLKKKTHPDQAYRQLLARVHHVTVE